MGSVESYVFADIGRYEIAIACIRIRDNKDSSLSKVLARFRLF